MNSSLCGMNQLLTNQLLDGVFMYQHAAVVHVCQEAERSNTEASRLQSCCHQLADFLKNTSEKRTLKDFFFNYLLYI